MTAERPASCSSPPAYTDDAWFAREQRLVFGRTWHVVAHVEQLALPGDFVDRARSAARRSRSFATTTGPCARSTTCAGTAGW